MGYLKDFRESFAKHLDGLTPEAKAEALNVACDALLESYRNGQRARRGRKEDGEKRSVGTRGKRQK